MKDQEPNKRTKAYAQYFGLALQMAVIIGAGTFAGVQLDNYFETNNNGFTAGVSLFSVLVAVFYAVRQILSISKKDN